MKFAFFGTDEFSIKVLDTLKKDGITPSLIITIPDRPQGRKMVLTPPPIKIWAEENKITYHQPNSLKNIEPEITDILKKGGYDFFLVASYGKIIPKDILEIPTHGTLNIHPSLLPKYRGPSPIETAILNGDEETGVTIIKLDEEVDHGPILAITKIELNDKYNAEILRDKLAEEGSMLLTRILPDYLSNKVAPAEQDHNLATFTTKFTKENGFLDQQASPLANYRKILALNPWPGTYMDFPGPKGKIRIIVKQAHLDGDKLVYDRVVPEGRKEMDWQSFLNGLSSAK